MSRTRRALRLAALHLASVPLRALGRLADRPARERNRTGTDGGLRILLIRPDHLGDVLLASPAASILRTALPGAQVDWLVGPWSAAVARQAGGGGDVRTVEFPGFTRQPKGSLVEPYQGLMHEAVLLLERSYDAALILRPDHWWGAMLAATAGIPRRFGFGVAECRPFLTDTLPIPQGHAVEANQALARLAAARLGGAGVSARHQMLAPCFPLHAADAVWAETWARTLPPLATGDPLDAIAPRTGPLVAIHPGTGAAVKHWLPERWAEVARALQETQRARLVLTGGPGEQGLVAAVAARLAPAPATLVGETTVGQLAALYARCALVIGGDSGPLHLAAAVGTPTVRLYGPTDIREFGPWPPRDGHAALAATLPCQPCRNLVAPPCGASETPPCMQAVPADAVIEAAARLLDAADRARPRHVTSATGSVPGH